MISLTDHQVRMARMQAQGLLERERRYPAALLGAICGVQAQDLGAGYLSMRARDSGLTGEAIDQARSAARAIGWGWCMRGTLHLTASEDLRWLVPMLGPRLIAGDRGRMRQLGWDEEKTDAGLRLLRDVLGEKEGLTRVEIRRLLDENGLPAAGQATPHLLFRAALEGLICAGPGKGKELRFMLFERWLGPPVALDRKEALALLARRYLAAYAPAADGDLAAWSGLKRSEAREAWDLIGTDRVEVRIGDSAAWSTPPQMDWLERAELSEPVARLLPAWDTYLLGHADRGWAVAPDYARRVQPGGGIIAAVMLVDGMAQGTWKIKRLSQRIEVQVEPFQAVGDDLVELLESEAADIGRFLGQDARLVIKR